MPRMQRSSWVASLADTCTSMNALAPFSMQTASFGKRADLVQPYIAC